MFNIVQKKTVFFAISLVLIAAGIVCFFINGGFNADIDFVGGSQITIPGINYDEAEITKAISSIEGVEVSDVVEITSEGGGAIVKTKFIKNAETTTAIKELVQTKYKVKEVSVDSISPTVGKELLQSAIIAVLLAALLMLIYIAFRFELLSGFAAVIALVHDLLIMASFYVIFRIPVNTSFIAALLTILGYSINATIVIFDRIRENARTAKKNAVFSEVVNTSIWNTLSRSINTSLTTLFTLVALYILGVESIKEFALPLIIGVIAGCYSSVFISGPVWAMLKGDKKGAQLK